MPTVIRRPATALRRPIFRPARPMPNALRAFCMGAAHLFDFGNTLHRPFIPKRRIWHILPPHVVDGAALASDWEKIVTASDDADRRM